VAVFFQRAPMPITGLPPGRFTALPAVIKITVHSFPRWQMKIGTVTRANTDAMDTIQISVDKIQDALDAMAWTFNTYLDEPFLLRDYPVIIELIGSYNSIAALLPEPFRSQYPEVSF